MNERLVIVFKKCECECKRRKAECEEDTDIDRQELECEIRKPCTTCEVAELAEGQRTEYFVLDINELWHLELHIYNCTAQQELFP